MRLSTLLILLFISFYGNAAMRSSLSGRITDTAGAPLAGAIVELPDLHTGAATDTAGRYTITNLPSGRFLVSVRLLGFASQSVTITLNGRTVQDFRLSEAVLEQHEVVVTGTSAASEQRRSTTPIQSITMRQMRENASTNVIDAVSRVPGVQQLSTGPAISKPVIRGLGYNRVVTLSDGIRQEGQQWGDEHGIEIDDYNVSRVEVLKGPASLSYGSDAIAGVINILSEEPAPINHIQATLAGNYQTNNGQEALHARIAGNENGLYWSAYYTGKRAHDYQNTYDGYVFNTRFSNNNFGATLGMNKYWGSSRISFTSFNQLLGIAEGARDSATGRFVKDVDNNGTPETVIVDDAEGKSYARALPRQQINHQKLTWTNNVYLANGARAGLILGFQQNERREFGDVLNPDEPGLHLRLQTVNYDAHYLFKELNGWQLSVGANGMLQHNTNLGIEFLVPDYHLFDIGGYAIARREIGKWSIAGGLRMDYRSITADALFVDSMDNRVSEPVAGGYARFGAFSKTFSAPSGSAGVSYAYSKHTTFKINFASGYRAPNIAELSANGVHEGAIRYEYGSTALKQESSFQGDLGMEYNSKHISVNAAVFYNYIHNYIFIRKLSAVDGTDSIPTQNNTEGFPAFIFSQSNAALTGGELYIDFHPHPLDWLHLENTISYVQGQNLEGTDSTRYLPNMPAPRWLVALRAQKKALGKHIGSPYVKLELDHYFEQNQVFSAYGTETSSAAYTLLNASLGFDLLQKGRTIATVTLAGQNLGDIGYQNHLSRLRFADINNVTGRQGIFGMGRNLSLSLSVPLSLR
jgi:iron complex outermembrane receptor protein